MAVVFPTTPAPDQVVTDPATNATWRWDAPSQRWVPAATGGVFVTPAQLAAAIAAIPTWTSMTVYDVGTYSFPPPPTGICQYEIWGGGGGSGGVTNGGTSGAGGGGAYVFGVASGLTTATTVIVGAGGTAGAYPTGTGGVGGESSFGAVAHCYGGGGGGGMSGLGNGVPGVGGTGSGGSFVQNGVPGTYGTVMGAPAVAFCGYGGSAYKGSFRPGPISLDGMSGTTGGTRGQGASGSVIDAGGAAGAPGLAIIRW